MATNILGIHYGHDATAVLLQDGVVLEAMSEERLSRAKKHTGFPHRSVEYLKSKYGIAEFTDVVLVGEFPEQDGYIFMTEKQNHDGRNAGAKPRNDFLRAMGVSIPLLGWVIRRRDASRYARSTQGMKEKVDAYVQAQFPRATVTRLSHHLAHAWSTVLFTSDYEKRLILTLDGAGDDLSGSINIFENGTIRRLYGFPIHASVGLLYASMVDLLGMARNEHEFKVMGLAPYAKASSGEKVFAELQKLLWFDANAMTFRSLLETNSAVGYFVAHNFHRYRFDSLAYGIQKLTEKLILNLAHAAITKYGIHDVAVAGGVFMNVKANQLLLATDDVVSLTVVPSCGDESLALGAVAYRYSELHDHDLSGLSKLKDIYLGSAYNDAAIKEAIDAYPYASSCDITYYDPASGTTIEHKVAEILAGNSVVGRFKGRAEWGARALGNRSILANASSRDNVKLINEMIKGRDFWMPFATSMLYEDRDIYLDDPKNFFAPYMSITFSTKPPAHNNLIAALHPYDLTSRPQMVSNDMNPEYHALITHFKSLTGVGGILNTSFNLHGEPNVEAPIDALRTFEHSGLPHLALGNYLLSKRSS